MIVVQIDCGENSRLNPAIGLSFLKFGTSGLPVSSRPVWLTDANTAVTTTTANNGNIAITPRCSASPNASTARPPLGSAVTRRIWPIECVKSSAIRRTRDGTTIVPASSIAQSTTSWDLAT